MKQKNSKILNNLASLSETGISTLEIAERVASSHGTIISWARVVSRLQAGNTLSLALASSDLINPFEQQIIASAEFSGRTSEGLRVIAKSYDKRRQWIGRAQAKLLSFEVYTRST